MKSIYLVRHGQSTSNAGGQLQPNKDIELTILGHEQAYEVANWVIDTLGIDTSGNNIQSVNVSSYLRTQQTAQPLLVKLQVEPQVIEGLQEFNYMSVAKAGLLSFDERLKMANHYWDTQHPSIAHGEDAETFDNFYHRVSGVLKHFETFTDGNHVVYTHGFWISMLIWQILGQPSKGEEAMRKFRQFEQSIRAQNCEVFCLRLIKSPASIKDDRGSLLTQSETITAQVATDYLPSIVKVRSCPQQNSDFSA